MRAVGGKILIEKKKRKEKWKGEKKRMGSILSISELHDVQHTQHSTAQNDSTTRLNELARTQHGVGAREKDSLPTK